MTKNTAQRLQSLLQALSLSEQELLEQGLQRYRQAGYSPLAALEHMLSDPSESRDIRLMACRLLGQTQAKRYVPAFLGLLRGPEDDYAFEAAKALKQIGGQQTIQELITLLETTQQPEQRAATVYALGLMADLGARASLLKILTTPSESARIRGFAAEALAQYHQDTTVTKALLTTLDDPAPELRFWAVFALGQQGSAEAIPALAHVAATDTTLYPGYGTIQKEAQDAIQCIYRALEESKIPDP